MLLLQKYLEALVDGDVDLPNGLTAERKTKGIARGRRQRSHPGASGEGSATLRSRVLAARGRQRERLRVEGVFSNAQMSPRQIRCFCKLNEECERLLEQAMTRQGLSARAYDRILKVSRTIADLEGSDEIGTAHVAEAVGYRSLDRTYRA